jgi:hypothetical protein
MKTKRIILLAAFTFGLCSGLCAEEITLDKVVEPQVSFSGAPIEMGKITVNEGEKLEFVDCRVNVLSVKASDLGSIINSVKPLLSTHGTQSPAINISIKHPLSNDFILKTIATWDYTVWAWRVENIGAGWNQFPFEGPFQMSVSIRPQGLSTLKMQDGRHNAVHLPKQTIKVVFRTSRVIKSNPVESSNRVLVLPETSGDATLVLEGSDDMVNWTVETLGDKPKANRKKFYRLRAKKK